MASPLPTTHRGINRNLLILGSASLLALGGLAAFIASRKGGNDYHTKQNITTDIIHNSFFTQLIASGATTEKDLNSIAEIRPYGDGFIGISKETSSWEESMAMAKRAGAGILLVEDSAAGSKLQLIKWLATSWAPHLSKPVWVRENNEARVLDGSDVLAGGSMDRQRKVLLQWSNPAGEPKQADIEHQRKLAEAVLSKKGSVEIWLGTGQIKVSRIENLPKGKLSLKGIECSALPFTNEDAALLNGCQELENLTIIRGTVTSLPLQTLPNLTSLNISECRLDPATFRGLRDNKHLTRVILNRGPKEAEIVEILASCPNLQLVSLEYSGLKNVSLSPFKKLKSLRNLTLGDKTLTEADLQSLTEIQSLEELKLVDMNLTVMPLDFLPKLKNTYHINMIGCKLSSNTMASVAAMPKLNSLYLWAAQVTDEMLAPLNGKKELRYLNLEHTAVTGDVFATLEPFPKLEDLRLRGVSVQVSDTGAQALVKACPALKVLLLNGKLLTSEGLGHLLSLKQLTELRLYDAPALDPSWLAALASKEKLVILELSGCSLTDADIALLEPRKFNLSELSIQNNRVTDESLPALKNLRSLKKLDITGTHISKEAVGALRQALPACEVRY